jgi:hypothetical protein
LKDKQRLQTTAFGAQSQWSWEDVDSQVSFTEFSQVRIVTFTFWIPLEPYAVLLLTEDEENSQRKVPLL